MRFAQYDRPDDFHGFPAGSDKQWSVYFSASEVTNFSQWEGRQNGTRDADTVARFPVLRKSLRHVRQSALAARPAPHKNLSSMPLRVSR